MVTKPFSELREDLYNSSPRAAQRVSDKVEELSKPTAVIDIDGVCCDQVRAFNMWVSKVERCPEIPFEDTEYLWFLRYPNGEARWKEFLGPQHAHRWLRAPAIAGARAGIRMLSWQYNIVFATYRPPHAAQVTRDWLRLRLGVKEPQVVFTKDKSSVPADVYLDDHGDTVRALIDAGLNAWAYDQPWNRAPNEPQHADLPRLNGWVEVLQALRLPQGGTK